MNYYTFTAEKMKDPEFAASYRKHRESLEHGTCSGCTGDGFSAHEWYCGRTWTWHEWRNRDA